MIMRLRRIGIYLPHWIVVAGVDDYTGLTITLKDISLYIFVKN